MGSKEKLANEIEDIFRIAKYIYGKSDSVDWMKEAAEKTTTFLESKSKKEAEERYVAAKELFGKESSYDKCIRLAAFGKEDDLL